MSYIRLRKLSLFLLVIGTLGVSCIGAAVFSAWNRFASVGQSTTEYLASDAPSDGFWLIVGFTSYEGFLFTLGIVFALGTATVAAGVAASQRPAARAV